MSDDHGLGRQPNSIETEQAVLGCILFAPKSYEIAVGLLTGPDFYRPNHEQLWLAMKALVAEGAPISATALAEFLTRTNRPNLLTLLPELLTTYCLPAQLEYHADVLRALSARRRGIEASVSALQDFTESADAVETILERVESAFRKVPTAREEHVGELMNLDEFCDQELPDNDWIVPGLLNRGDRLVLTGGEGLGKTVMMRQIAVCAAAGVHPFTYQAVPRQTVLYVDAENPKSIMVHSFEALRKSIREKRGPMDATRLWIERRPAGLNLADPGDRLWLSRLAALVNPDLLCIGPAYKLYVSSGNQREEDLARQVTSALDAIREEANCALILEHHAPHGEGQERAVRPIGSSLWLRWPEFGYGLRPAKDFNKDNRSCDFVPWRGPRDERSWPERVNALGSFLPWMDERYT
jgi:replicative DNA helicase